MKKLWRYLSLLLVILLAMGMGSSAFAEETDPYVYDFAVTGNGYTGKTYQYFSAYMTQALYDGQVRREQHYVRNLYNTVTQQVVPTYCTDIETAAALGKQYRQINLEDSSYASKSAGLLRAILLNGFYLDDISLLIFYKLF